MGFFDSIKKTVKSVFTGSESSEPEIEVNAENYQKYYDILENFYLTFRYACEQEWKIAPDCAERAVQYFCANEPIDAPALQKALKDYNSKSGRLHVTPKAEYDTDICIELRHPGLLGKLAPHLSFTIDDLARYKDYDLNSVFVKLLSSVGMNDRAYYGSASLLFMEEIKKRVLEADESMINKLLFAGELALSNARHSFDHAFRIAWKITNFKLQKDTGSFKPISREEWTEVVKAVYKSSLEGLSPEGAENEINRILKIVTEQNKYGTSKFNEFFAVKTDPVLHDAMVYYAYYKFVAPEELGTDATPNIEAIMDYAQAFADKYLSN